MIPTSHLLVLSHPDFLDRQVRGVLDDAQTGPKRPFWRWAMRSHAA
jgi:hypothetical protein